MDIQVVDENGATVSFARSFCRSLIFLLPYYLGLDIPSSAKLNWPIKASVQVLQFWPAPSFTWLCSIAATDWASTIWLLKRTLLNMAPKFPPSRVLLGNRAGLFLRLWWFWISCWTDFCVKAFQSNLRALQRHHCVALLPRLFERKLRPVNQVRHNIFAIKIRPRHGFHNSRAYRHRRRVPRRPQSCRRTPQFIRKILRARQSRIRQNEGQRPRRIFHRHVVLPHNRLQRP